MVIQPAKRREEQGVDRSHIRPRSDRLRETLARWWRPDSTAAMRLSLSRAPSVVPETPATLATWLAAFPALLHCARVGRVLVLTAGAISPEHNLLDVVLCADLVLPEREQS